MVINYLNLLTMDYTVEQKVGDRIYLYEAKSYWDKEKKQSRQKRKYLKPKGMCKDKLLI